MGHKKISISKSKPVVAILMGSGSDAETLKHSTEVLKEFGVSFKAKVLSAHRTPEETARFVKKASSRGFKVIIAAAGGAAHLAGTCAALTTLPVIGIPIESSSLKGLDSLLSTVQMPGGVPVATVSIGSAGAKNAALLALRILALSDKALAKKVETYKEKMRQSVLNQKTGF